MARRKWLEVDSVELTIETDDIRGWGRGQWEERPFQLKGVIAGERVTAKPLQVRRRVVQGELRTVIAPAAARTTPFCPHFIRCGGCSNQHFSPADQRARKARFLNDVLAAAGVDVGVVAPPLYGVDRHYRTKARLGVRYLRTTQRAFVGFRQSNSNRVEDLTDCGVLDRRLAALVPHLNSLVGALSAPHSIPQLELAAGCATVGGSTSSDSATDSDSESPYACAMVLRHLSPLTRADEGVLRTFGETHQIRILLQPGSEGAGHTVLLHPSEGPGASSSLSYRLSVRPGNPGDATSFKFAFHPQEFTQVNHELNNQLVSQALEWLAPTSNETLLDLFCGLGNFSLPMARGGARVVGLEGADALVERARDNARGNGMTNLQFATADLYSDAAGSALAPYADVAGVLADPPRSGLGTVRDWLSEHCRARRLVYVSCNPETFAADAAVLQASGWRLATAGIIDMFPHTAHVESMGLFERAAPVTTATEPAARG